MTKMWKSSNRDILFVREGIHKGIFLVEMDRKEDQRVFLGLPDKEIHEVPEKDVQAGLRKKILQVVEKLPRCVYNVCKKEYNLILSEQQRINSNNRREPSLCQSVQD